MADGPKATTPNACCGPRLGRLVATLMCCLVAGAIITIAEFRSLSSVHLLLQRHLTTTTTATSSALLRRRALPLVSGPPPPSQLVDRRPLLHLYLTDFCLGQHRESLGFLEDRLRIFETFTLPSMASQTAKPDGWAIFVTAGLPPVILDRLKALVAPLPWADVVPGVGISHVGAPAHKAASRRWIKAKRDAWMVRLAEEAYGAAGRRRRRRSTWTGEGENGRRADEWEEWEEPLVLYTGIDSDDALATFFTERVQSLSRHKARFDSRMLEEQGGGSGSGSRSDSSSSSSSMSSGGGSSARRDIRQYDEEGTLWKGFVEDEETMAEEDEDADADGTSTEEGGATATEGDAIAAGATSAAAAARRRRRGVLEYFFWGLTGLKWHPTRAGLGRVDTTDWGEVAPFLGLTVAVPQQLWEKRMPLLWRHKHDQVCRQAELKRHVERRCAQFVDLAPAAARRPSYLYVRSAASDSAVGVDVQNLLRAHVLVGPVAQALGWDGLVRTYGLNAEVLAATNAALMASTADRLSETPKNMAGNGAWGQHVQQLRKKQLDAIRTIPALPNVTTDASSDSLCDCKWFNDNGQDFRRSQCPKGDGSICFIECCRRAANAPAATTTTNNNNNTATLR